MAWQWAAILAENQGEIEQSGSTSSRRSPSSTRARPPGRSPRCNTQAGDAALQHRTTTSARPPTRGRRSRCFERLHADDDATSMRISLALSAMRQGRLEDADRLLDEIGEVPIKDVTAGLVTAQVRAELRLVRGDVEGGLAALDRSLDSVREWGFGHLSSQGLEPWILVALATDLAAHARFASTPAQRARAAELAAETGDLLEKLPSVPDTAVDFPITGMSLAALGAWLLIDDEADARVEPAIRLIALARGFGYNRWFPVMAWEPLVSLAEAAAPGRLAAVLERVRRPPGPGAAPGGRAGAGLGTEIWPHIFRVKLRTDSGAKIATIDGAAEQCPADLRGDLAVVGQVADRRDDVGDRVDVGEGLEPGRHRVGRDERVGQERQREHHHQRDGLHALGAAADGAEPGEDPGQRPAGDDREQDRARPRRGRRRRAGSRGRDAGRRTSACSRSRSAACRRPSGRPAARCARSAAP